MKVKMKNFYTQPDKEANDTNLPRHTL